MSAVLIPNVMGFFKWPNFSCAVAYSVEALCYNPDERGFDSKCHGIFKWPNFSCSVALDSTQPLTNEYQDSWGGGGGESKGNLGGA
jgi:hypothetical protein